MKLLSTKKKKLLFETEVTKFVGKTDNSWKVLQSRGVPNKFGECMVGK